MSLLSGPGRPDSRQDSCRGPGCAHLSDRWDGRRANGAHPRNRQLSWSGSINGYQLASIMRKQAKSFGCDIRSNIKVAGLSMEGPVKSATLGNGETFTADALILTPGGRPRTLGVEGETAFKGKGISYCATCDGDFFTGKEVVGWRRQLRAGRSRFPDEIRFQGHHCPSIRSFSGVPLRRGRSPGKRKDPVYHALGYRRWRGSLESVRIRNLDTDAVIEYPTDGVFIFIGYLPNRTFSRGKLP